MWWLSGIFRDVWLLARPAGGIEDLFVSADYDHVTGGGTLRVSVSEAVGVAQQATEMIALDRALTGLAEMDPRKGQIVEMKFFGGLTTEEVAAVLGVTPRTVEREWRAAKAWLHRAVGEGEPDEA